MEPDLNYRDLCLKCLRPTKVCYCAHIAPIESKSHFLILMHIKEFKKMPVGTGRMTHLGLKNSTLIMGIDYSEDRQFLDLIEKFQGKTYVLWPGPKATVLGPGSGLQDQDGQLFIMVDATWFLAKKMMRVNPILQRLPHISLNPSAPSNYRIRKEPSDSCVSTVEATTLVCQALGIPETERLLKPFTHMVDQQIELTRTMGNSRQRR